jgi:hypothetical protein
MDFVHNQLATGRKLRVLTVVDTFSRFSPALEPRFTFRGIDVVILEEVGRQVGFPATIRARDRNAWAIGFTTLKMAIVISGLQSTSRMAPAKVMMVDL